MRVIKRASFYVYDYRIFFGPVPSRQKKLFSRKTLTNGCQLKSVKNEKNEFHVKEEVKNNFIFININIIKHKINLKEEKMSRQIKQKNIRVLKFILKL